MALPPADVARVQQWCAEQVPVEQQDQVRVTCETSALHLTLHEEPLLKAIDGDETCIFWG